MTGGNSTYTKDPITEEVIKSGSDLLTYELNGGSKKLAKMLVDFKEKTGKPMTELGQIAKIGKGSFGKYARGQNTGITLGTLKKIAKLLGIPAMKLSKQILGTHKPTKKAMTKQPKLDKLLAALGVDQSELACSFTIGDDRITVERMPGQEGQPVIVEHNGHRLTVEKV